MAASINLTAAVMMVLHAVLGCCWHHVHASPYDHAVPSSMVAARCCGHAHRASHEADASHEHSGSAVPGVPACPHDSPDDSCDQSKCSLIAVVPADAAAREAASAPAADWCLPTFDLASATVSRQASFDAARVDRRGPPDLPLRVLLGVWRL
ncbi:MAG TPA: hypothetical protein VGE52_22420 [Pirellulales bacterium]